MFTMLSPTFIQDAVKHCDKRIPKIKNFSCRKNLEFLNLWILLVCMEDAFSVVLFFFFLKINCEGLLTFRWRLCFFLLSESPRWCLQASSGTISNWWSSCHLCKYYSLSQSGKTSFLLRQFNCYGSLWVFHLFFSFIKLMLFGWAVSIMHVGFEQFCCFRR